MQCFQFFFHPAKMTTPTLLHLIHHRIWSSDLFSIYNPLDAFGNPAAVPANHGAQSPKFNKMSSHYIELAPGPFTLLGDGDVLFHNAETTAGGATAIDFSKSYPVANNEVFYSMPIKDVTPGTYQWLRVSLAYQNYDVEFRYNVAGTNYDFNGTLA